MINNIVVLIAAVMLVFRFEFDEYHFKFSLLGINSEIHFSHFFNFIAILLILDIAYVFYPLK